MSFAIDLNDDPKGRKALSYADNASIEKSLIITLSAVLYVYNQSFYFCKAKSDIVAVMFVIIRTLIILNCNPTVRLLIVLNIILLYSLYVTAPYITVANIDCHSQ